MLFLYTNIFIGLCYCFNSASFNVVVVVNLIVIKGFFNQIEVYVKRILKKVSLMSVGKQEFVNFLFSMLFVIALLILMVSGVQDDGGFKNLFVEKSMNALMSFLTLYMVLIFFLPLFLLLLLKAALFEVPQYPLFNVIAQFFTGTFYSLGMCISAFSVAAVPYGVEFDSKICMFGLSVTFLGYAVYEILQMAIQRTSTPTT